MIVCRDPECQDVDCGPEIIPEEVTPEESVKEYPPELEESSDDDAPARTTLMDWSHHDPNAPYRKAVASQPPIDPNQEEFFEIVEDKVPESQEVETKVGRKIIKNEVKNRNQSHRAKVEINLIKALENIEAPAKETEVEGPT